MKIQNKDKEHDNCIVKKIFKDTDITLLMALPFVFSMIILIGWMFLGRILFPDGISQEYNNIVIAIAAFISGFSGIIQILRRESPGPFGKNEYIAIIGGIMTAGIFWLLGLLMIFMKY